MTNSIKHVVAALKMPSKMGDKIIHAQSIHAKLLSNPNFPAPWPGNVSSLAQLGTDINNLVSAEAAVKNHTGTAAARNVALAVVVGDLRSILSMVQLKADSNPANANSIIAGAGFSVKVVPHRQKQVNGAYNTEVLGTVLLTADTHGHHQWQMSKDKVAITDLEPTSLSHTFVTGLHTGDVWYFRSKKVNTPTTIYNWCAWIELTVGSGGKNTGKGGHAANSGSISSE